MRRNGFLMILEVVIFVVSIRFLVKYNFFMFYLIHLSNFVIITLLCYRNKKHIQRKYKKTLKKLKLLLNGKFFLITEDSQKLDIIIKFKLLRSWVNRQIIFVGFNLFIFVISIPVSLHLDSNSIDFIQVCLLYFVFLVTIIVFGIVIFPSLIFAFIPTLPLMVTWIFANVIHINGFSDENYLNLLDKWPTILFFFVSTFICYLLFYFICPLYVVRDILTVKGPIITLVITVMILFATYYIPQKLTTIIEPTEVTVSSLTSAPDIPDDIKHMLKKILTLQKR